MSWHEPPSAGATGLSDAPPAWPTTGRRSRRAARRISGGTRGSDHQARARSTPVDGDPCPHGERVAVQTGQAARQSPPVDERACGRCPAGDVDDGRRALMHLVHTVGTRVLNDPLRARRNRARGPARGSRPAPSATKVTAAIATAAAPTLITMGPPRPCCRPGRARRPSRTRTLRAVLPTRPLAVMVPPPAGVPECPA